MALVSILWMSMSHLMQGRGGEGGEASGKTTVNAQERREGWRGVAPNQRAVCCSRGVASDFDICSECLCEHEINAEGQVEEAGGERVGQSVVLNLTSGETPALKSISTRASAAGSASWRI